VGFFQVKESVRQKGVQDETLHRMECGVCPLKAMPKREPTGSKKPIIYMLGEYAGCNFEKLIRRMTPEEWDGKTRWNHVVRSEVQKGKNVNRATVECCRSSVARDIVATKPEAIFGFGSLPLQWAINETNMPAWVNRMTPIRVRVPLTDEYHDCWYFPLFDPKYMNRMRHTGGTFGENIESIFQRNMKWAFEQVGGAGLPKPVPHNAAAARSGVEFVTGHKKGDLKRVMKFLFRVEQERLLGLDYETNMLRPYNKDSKILTVAISANSETLAFPIHHPGAGWSEQERLSLQAGYWAWLLRTEAKIAVHNAAFELEWSGKFGGKKTCRRAWEDTMSQAYILDGRKGCMSLEFLVLQHFGINIKELAGLNRKNLAAEPVEEVLMYNGIDAKYHRALYQVQRSALKDAGLMDVYREHMKRVPTMVLTQLLGLPVDQKRVETLHAKYTVTKLAAEKVIMNHAAVKRFKKSTRREFTISKPADVRKALASFGYFPEKIDKVTLKDAPKGGGLDDFLKALIDWRESEKVLKTYVEPCRPGIGNLFDDGKLHPIIATTTTSTWRTSSYEPNIQNWPNRNEAQKEVRKQIRPRKGPRGPRRIVSFDYGQIQARNVAMESKDKKLVEAFWTEYDIHSDWRDRIAKYVPSWLDKTKLDDPKYMKAKRNVAKNGLVFPSFFGAGRNKVASIVEIPVEVAGDLLNDFWSDFPDIKRWHERVFRDYEKYGYVTGCTGFRRRAPLGRNELINAPIQADEAAIVCDAMARLSEMGMQAAMEIHDDLTFIWYTSEIEKNAEIVINEMLACPFEWAHIVPLSVEWSVGDDWYSKQDQGTYASNKWTGKL
jgi:DNA polymerase I-like protein with 3'-5' exonuclease and polymerase domains